MKKENSRDELKRPKRKCTLQIALHRTRRTFERAHAIRTVKPDPKFIAEFCCRTQIINVSAMKKVETAVRQNKFFPGLGKFFSASHRRFKRREQFRILNKRRFHRALIKQRKFPYGEQITSGVPARRYFPKKNVKARQAFF